MSVLDTVYKVHKWLSLELASFMYYVALVHWHNRKSWERREAEDRAAGGSRKSREQQEKRSAVCVRGWQLDYKLPDLQIRMTLTGL